MSPRISRRMPISLVCSATVLASVVFAQAPEVRPIVQASIAGIGLAAPGLVDVKMMRIGAGILEGERLGVCATAGVIHKTGRNVTATTPLGIEVLYDLTPESRFGGLFAYAEAAFIPSLVTSLEWKGNAAGLRAGLSYTWYCFTPHIEFNVLESFNERHYGELFPSVALGIELGGMYVLGLDREAVGPR